MEPEPSVAQNSSNLKSETLLRRVEKEITPARFILGLVLAATLVVYIGSLTFGFVYDDHEQIVNNPHVLSWRNVYGYFAQPLWAQMSPARPHNYYRPVFQLWLTANQAVFGARPWGWHLAAVLLHVGVTLLVYLVVRRIVKDAWTASLSALLFGLHPVHTENVAWVSGVLDPLMSLFLLAAFLCFLSQREAKASRRLWLAASLALYALAALTKETAVVFPALIFVYVWLDRPARPELGKWNSLLERCGNSLWATLPFLSIAVVYLGARWRVLGALGYSLTPLPFSPLALTWPSLLWFYLRHFIWPVGLSEFYDTAYVENFGWTNFMAPLAAVLAAAFALVWVARRSRQAAFAVWWLALPLLPVLDIRTFARGEVTHDRYLYLSSIGLAILVALAVRRLHRGDGEILQQPAVQVIVAGGLAICLGLVTGRESLIWANDVTLSTRGVQVAPKNPAAWNNLGRGWGDRGDFPEAERHFLHALELDPDYWDANFNLGLLYYRERQLENAEKYLNQAIRIYPFDTHAYHVLAEVKVQQGKLKEAAEILRQGLQADPGAIGFHLALGALLKVQGDLPGALAEFQAELERYPDNSLAQDFVTETEAAIKSSGSDQPAPEDGKSVQPPKR